MAHIGKIACHFPGLQPNPNHDVEDIKFLPPGGTVNDLLHIKKVYAIPAGATVTSVSDLAQYVVWEWVDTLAAGAADVCIEFIPSTNIPLSNVGIFTNNITSSTYVNFVVYHESGLIVAKNNGDTIDSSTSSKYGLSGQRRVDAVSDVTLKAGYKYYIQYTDHTDHQSSSFYPAYFDGVTGHYKNYVDTGAQNKMVANINSTTGYAGVIDDSSRVFGMPAGTLFVWNGSANVGMTPGSAYVRSNIGQNYAFSGIVGNPASWQSITKEYALALLGKPANTEFIWYVGGYPDMDRGTIWAKPVSTANWSTIDFYEYSYGEYQLEAQLMAALNTNAFTFCIDGKWWYSTAYIGYKFSLKPGYTSYVTSHTAPLSELPANPVNGGIYYLAKGLGDQPIYGQDACQVYENGAWTTIGNNNWTDYIKTEGLTTWLEYIGRNSDFTTTEFDQYRMSANLREATLQTDKKYYLEINGNEV